jgi:uncharacterized protein YgbK (DUF1537 family)
VLGDDREAHLANLVAAVAAALAKGNVVVGTSRTLVRGTDGADSLRIARAVSDAVVQVVRQVLDLAPPRFVIAKGGITSSDVASRGLEMALWEFAGYKFNSKTIGCAPSSTFCASINFG